MRISLQELRCRLLQKSSRGEPIRFRRLSPALCNSPEDIASADLLLVDHLSTCPHPNPAAELLPLRNANEEMLRNAARFQQVIAQHPAIAGVCGTDPFALPEKLLEEIKKLGFMGVQNTPSIGLIGGSFREHLENSRISYQQEIAMLTHARQLGLLTLGTVFSEADAKEMLAAGIDALALHPGAKGLVSKEPRPQVVRHLRAVCGEAGDKTIFMETATVD